MNTIYRIATALLLTATVLWGGGATLTVDRATVAQGESVTATLQATGHAITLPSLTAVGPYPVTSSRVSEKTSFSLGGGNHTSQHTKSLRFSFFPDANVTIPPLKVTVDGQTVTTKPVRITVGASRQSQDDFSLKMIASRSTVYVGEPFLLQVIFYEPRNAHLAQPEYYPPHFDGFLVKTSRQERLENTPTGTAHIFDYILTPQKEGNLTIPAPQVKLGIRTFSGTRDPWGLFGNDLQWRSLRAQPLTLSVRPAPSDADLVGNYRIHASVKTTHAQPNKPISYSLQIDGVGSLEDYDGPTFDIDGVTIYSDDPNVTTHLDAQGRIHSRWNRHYTFIADRDFTIPGLEIRVFDPATQSIQRLRTPAQSIRVGRAHPATASPSKPPSPSAAPASGLSAQSTPPSAITETPPAATDANRSILEDTAYYAREARKRAAAMWPTWSLILAGIVGVVVGFFLDRFFRTHPLRRRSIHRRRYSIDEALDILYPHTNASPEIEKMVRDLYRARRGESVQIDPDRLQRILQDYVDTQVAK